jgi:cation:H+ antiporter
MVMDARQVEEMFLRAAQSILALTVLANLSFGLWEAVLLLGLFLLQFVFPTPAVRMILGASYLVIAAGYLLTRSHRRAAADLFRYGWRSHARRST